MAKFGSNKPQNIALNSATAPSEPITTEADTPVLTKEEIATVLENNASIDFRPNEDQRRYKSRWWYRYKDGNYPPISKMDLNQAYQVAPSEKIKRWWPNPRFVEWLLNETENGEKLENLFSIALDEAEDIIRSRDPRFLASKVAMIKLVAELANKMPKKEPEVYIDKQIAAMSAEDLRKFIASKSHHLNAQVITATEVEDGK